MTGESDSKNLIFESYRIEGITVEECRSIFVDWALSLKDSDPVPHLEKLLELYGEAHPDHPMTGVLKDGLKTPPAKGYGTVSLATSFA